jgi:hypothetical protein
MEERMLSPIPPSLDARAAVLMLPNAMEIVAAERLKQHEKIIRLRALREEAAAAGRERGEKSEPSRFEINEAPLLDLGLT